MVRPLHLPAVIHTLCSRASPSGPIDHAPPSAGHVRMVAKASAGTCPLPASGGCVLLVIFRDSPQITQRTSPSLPTLRARDSQQCGSAEAASPTPLVSGPAQSPPLPRNKHLHQRSWSLCVLLEGEYTQRVHTHMAPQSPWTADCQCQTLPCFDGSLEP